MKKAKAVETPPLSQAELIAKSLAEAQMDYCIPMSKPGYLYKKGQAIQYGQLIDVRVEEVLDDGKFIALSHHSTGSERGTNYDHGRRFFGVRPWHELAPLDAICAVTYISPRKNYVTHTSTLGDTLHTLERSGIQDSPDYQRGYVWTEQDKVHLIHSIMTRSDIGKFVLVELSELNGHRFEILDGKQRLGALLEFIKGGFKYCGRYHWELTYADRKGIENTLVPVVRIPDSQLTRVEKLELFLNVNAAGVPQTEAHLLKVRQLLTEAKAQADF